MTPSTVTASTFARAVEQLRAARPRPELTISEVPAPQRLAPYAYALGGAVCPEDDPAGEPDAAEAEIASGRLVLLYDPAGQAAWRGSMRLVSYVTAELEPDLATDALLAEVGWSWLEDALAAHGAGHVALGGTVTQTTSTRFGELAGPPPAADVEIRASWTPQPGTDLGPHAHAWCALLASAAGLPPPGVSTIRG